MKVVFNGLIEKKSAGCKPCGTARKTGFGYVNSKMYILPSGLTKTFYVGQPETVSEKDGQFLLSYVYKDANGTNREVFTRIE